MEVSTPDDESIVPGWVRIKLTEDAQALRTGVFTRGAVESGNADLDAIAEQLGATEIRRVFSDGGKYAERRRKHGLHLWYDVKLGEEVPVSRAEAGMRTLPGVQYAIPLYRLVPDEAQIVPDMAAELQYEGVMAAALDASRPVVEPPFNDELLGQQWHYYNTGLDEGTAEARISTSMRPGRRRPAIRRSLWPCWIPVSMSIMSIWPPTCGSTRGKFPAMALTMTTTAMWTMFMVITLR